MFENKIDFYPTPAELADKMCQLVDFTKVKYILEPSAGKGDLIKAIKRKYDYYRDYKFDIDTIEKDEDLRSLLIGSEYRVVYDDFLTFNTFKNYDLVIMNPTFSEGAKHVLKAIDLLKNGGQLVAIINAETLNNPYSNERKLLCDKLEKLNAKVTTMKEAFTNAERPTLVEIALIYIDIPRQVAGCSFVLDNLERPAQDKICLEKKDKLTFYEVAARMVSQYNFEAKLGLQLLTEMENAKPYLYDNADAKDRYRKPLIDINVEGTSKYCSESLQEKINTYLEGLRYKYWSALKDSNIMRMMTSNLQTLYHNKIIELKKYDFNLYNIREVNKMLYDQMNTAVEETIINLFDKLSAEHAWYAGSKNIHYYNGWATNKAHKIDNKVIIGANAYDDIYRRMRIASYEVIKTIQDIEKTLNYLDQGKTDEYLSIGYVLETAENSGITKNIKTKYFSMTFYKKGTCHLTFNCPELIKKLNIYGSQKKGWLPPSYGKKRYEDMTPEEQRVIDEFEGQESYAETLAHKSYYLPEKTVNLIA